jgi:hypothetical protein
VKDKKKRKEFDVEKETSLVLRKEMMDGYYNFGKYKKEGNTDSEFIGQVYEIGGSKVYGAYSPSLREQMFGDTEFYKKKGRMLQIYQYNIIKELGHMTLFCVKRRAGKSYLLSFLAINEITKQRKRDKPVKVLFISPGDNKLDDVRDYMDSMANAFEGVYEFEKKDSRVCFYSIEPVYLKDESGEFIKNEDGSFVPDGDKTKKVLNGVIEFITAWGRDSGIGKFADLIIIDEANKVDELVLRNIMPIVTNE